MPLQGMVTVITVALARSTVGTMRTTVPRPAGEAGANDTLGDRRHDTLVAERARFELGLGGMKLPHFPVPAGEGLTANRSEREVKQIPLHVDSLSRSGSCMTMPSARPRGMIVALCTGSVAGTFSATMA